MTDQEMMRLDATVEGRVQGVGFRYFVLETAQGLGLTGWVRNRWDDTVEVSAEGPREDLEKLLAALERGPSMSFVSNVRTSWGEATGEYKRFAVLQTY